MQYQDLKISLDSEGFVRRECPKCEREFKLQTLEKDFQTPPVKNSGEVTCPYCKHRSSADQWWSKNQVKYINDMQSFFAFNFITPKALKIKSTPFVTVKTTITQTEEPIMPSEIDDMKRISITCCERDIKILENWNGDIVCPDCSKTL